jgi:cation transport regulator ChaB
MPYDSISDLPKGVTDNLPKHAQKSIWRRSLMLTKNMRMTKTALAV